MGGVEKKKNHQSCAISLIVLPPLAEQLGAEEAVIAPEIPGNALGVRMQCEWWQSESLILTEELFALPAPLSSFSQARLFPLGCI